GVEQGRAGGDERRAERDRADDAPEEHPPPARERERKRGEDQREDEDVVERQALLEHVPREVGARRPPALPAPDDAREADAESDVERAERDRRRERRFAAAAERDQVEREQHEQKRDEREPGFDTDVHVSALPGPPGRSGSRQHGWTSVLARVRRSLPRGGAAPTRRAVGPS